MGDFQIRTDLALEARESYEADDAHPTVTTTSIRIRNARIPILLTHSTRLSFYTIVIQQSAKYALSSPSRFAIIMKNVYNSQNSYA